MSSPLHTMDTTIFTIRAANPSDAATMTDIWYKAFQPTSPFWPYFFPDTPHHREWFTESFRMSMRNPTDKQFVVEDVKNEKKLVAFSRWMIPQADGNLNRDPSWPELDETQWDMDVAGAFFGGMETNHHNDMAKRPHWFCDLLAVLPEYQKQGLAGSLLKWATDQADEDGIETYLHATAKGRPYYEARHGFRLTKPVTIPDREAYGSYSYVSMVRPPHGGEAVAS